MRPSRIVIDTNVVIAGAIARESSPARAIDLAFQSGTVLASDELIVELKAVFSRPKFNRYSDLDNRLRYLVLFSEAATTVPVLHLVTECRDSKDNMVLALALAGMADLLITGDADLLSLHPWRGVPILTPSGYLALLPVI